MFKTLIDWWRGPQFAERVEQTRLFHEEYEEAKTEAVKKYPKTPKGGRQAQYDVRNKFASLRKKYPKSCQALLYAREGRTEPESPQERRQRLSALVRRRCSYCVKTPVVSLGGFLVWIATGIEWLLDRSVAALESFLVWVFYIGLSEEEKQTRLYEFERLSIQRREEQWYKSQGTRQIAHRESVVEREALRKKYPHARQVVEWERAERERFWTETLKMTVEVPSDYRYRPAEEQTLVGYVEPQ